MSDKDLLVVIAEMLRKQDQQAEKLGEHSVILNQHTEILNQHTEILNQHTGILNQHTEVLIEQRVLTKETNDTLKQFMEVSINQFQQQQEFNERFFNKLDDIAKALTK